MDSRLLRYVFCILVITVSQLILSVYGERGLWTFDSDPGFIEDRGSDTNFQWSISDGVMDLAMTREAYPQRVYMPLSTIYDNNNHMYRVRVRFKIIDPDAASVLIGFFNSTKWNVINTDAHVCFDLYSNINLPGGWFGGGYNHMSESVSLNTWYVLEMDYKATNSTMGFYLYEGDGVTLINSFRTSTTGMYDGVDVIGFGNEDRSANTTIEYIVVDWLSWAVNESLLPDPVPGTVEISETGEAVEVNEDRTITDTYTVVLGDAPIDDVTIELVPASPDQIQLSSADLVFTPGNWAAAQTVTVTAIDDIYPEDDPHSTTIFHIVSSNDTRYSILEKFNHTLQVAIDDNDCAWPLPGRGLWLFDEGPDSLNLWCVVDQSKNANHGVSEPTTASNAVYVTDTPFTYRDNYALDFGASTSAYIEIVDSPSLDITGALTVEAWVNMNSLNSEQHLISKRNSSGPDSGYWLRWSASSQAFLFYVGTASGVYNIQSQSFSPSTGVWYHIAGVHDPVVGENRLYINGQLNNSAASDPTIVTNDEMLVFGNRPSLTAPANAKLDEVRISADVVDAGKLGYWQTSGPGQYFWGDNFESYSSTYELYIERGTGYDNQLNSWHAYAREPGMGYGLTSSYHRSGSQAGIMYFDNVSTYGETAFYLKLPIGIVEDKVTKEGFEAWIAFDNIYEHRLLLMMQAWTGPENHYGEGPDTLIAMGIEYNGPTKTWSVPGDGYREYEQGMDVWHYMKLACSYEEDLIYTFQFDDDIWQWQDTRMYKDVHPLSYSVTDATFRIFYPYPGQEPPGGVISAQVAIDDVRLINEHVQFLHPDFNRDCRIDYYDFSIFTQHWYEVGPSTYDFNNDNIVDIEDLGEFSTHWLYEN